MTKKMSDAQLIERFHRLLELRRRVMSIEEIASCTGLSASVVRHTFTKRNLSRIGCEHYMDELNKITKRQMKIVNNARFNNGGYNVDIVITDSNGKSVTYSEYYLFDVKKVTLSPGFELSIFFLTMVAIVKYIKKQKRE